MGEIKIVDKDGKELIYKFEIKKMKIESYICNKGSYICNFLKCLSYFFISIISSTIIFYCLCKYFFRNISCINEICLSILIIFMLLCLTVYAVFSLKYISKKDKLLLLEKLSEKASDGLGKDSLFECEKIEKNVNQSQASKGEENRIITKQKNLDAELCKRIIESVSDV